MALLTFIIPVRHPDNSNDWNALKARLAQTAASIAAQSHDDWRAIIVANVGADMPPLPEGFSVERVTFAPNRNYDLASSDREAVYEAFRLDKGRRVLSGMLAARHSRFIMIVDDDDFVSSGIVAHAATHQDANGWTIDRGYFWSEGGKLMLRHDDFSSCCGTSHIVRTSLYDLPERFDDATDEYIRTMLGSHRRIAEILAKRGAALERLPFAGAVYRVGHSGAHSQSHALWRTLFRKRHLARPDRFVRELMRCRFVTKDMRERFFGGVSV